MKNLGIKKVILSNQKTTVTPEYLLNEGELAFFVSNNKESNALYILDTFYNESGETCVGFVKTPRIGQSDIIMGKVIKDHEDPLDIAKECIEMVINDGCIVKSTSRENMTKILVSPFI